MTRLKTNSDGGERGKGHWHFRAHGTSAVQQYFVDLDESCTAAVDGRPRKLNLLFAVI